MVLFTTSGSLEIIVDGESLVACSFYDKTSNSLLLISEMMLPKEVQQQILEVTSGIFNIFYKYYFYIYNNLFQFVIRSSCFSYTIQQLYQLVWSWMRKLSVEGQHGFLF